MGLFGSDEPSDQEIIDAAVERGPADCDVAAVVGVLENDDPELKNAAANVLVAAANERPERVAHHVSAFEPGFETDVPNTLECLLGALVGAHDPESPSGVVLLPQVVWALGRVGETEQGELFGATYLHQLSLASVEAREWLASVADREAFEPLVALATAEREEVRYRATSVLLGVSNEEPSAVAPHAEALFPCLADESARVVGNAVGVLAGATSDDRTALVDVADALVTVVANHPDETTRGTAAALVAETAQHRPGAFADGVGVFVESLAGDLEERRAELAHALAFVAEAAPERVAPHRDRLEAVAANDPDETVRAQTRAALDALPGA
jgi:hypothetical protein